MTPESIEQKAKEYAENMSGWSTMTDSERLCFAPDIYEASIHFRAGYESALKDIDFKTQVAYESGRIAERKEIVDFLKNQILFMENEGLKTEKAKIYYLVFVSLLSDLENGLTNKVLQK